MNQTERLYRINQLVNEHGCLPLGSLLDALEVSKATLKRDIAYLRDRLNAPLIFDRLAGGYRFDKPTAAGGPRYALPGLWFSADEIHALMTMNALLAELDPGGIIGKQVKPMIDRLEALLASANAPAREVMLRVKLVTNLGRPVRMKWFQMVGSALMNRQRLEIDYFARHRDERTTREVSPLRLVYHRSNWYLDAWCHKSNDIRVFAIDSMERAVTLDVKAKHVSLKEVDARVGSGYGIYKGERLLWAELRFDAVAARWVRSEQWHPKQVATELPDGRYQLRVPYAAPNELVMDILRHGERVEVIGPDALRAAVAERLRAAAGQYAP